MIFDCLETSSYYYLLILECSNSKRTSSPSLIRLQHIIKIFEGSSPLCRALCYPRIEALEASENEGSKAMGCVACASAAGVILGCTDAASEPSATCTNAGIKQILPAHYHHVCLRIGKARLHDDIYTIAFTTWTFSYHLDRCLSALAGCI